MSVACLLVMLGAALIHGSTALQCYQCVAETCTESLDTAIKVDCSSNEICGKLVADSVKIGQNAHIFLVASTNCELCLCNRPSNMADMALSNGAIHLPQTVSK